jgi:hypothetical protein
MLLTLILSATPFVCPDGNGAYERNVARAARDLGVTQELFVEITPNWMAPDAFLPNGNPTKAVAWVPRVPHFDYTIYIRYDMVHAMSCDAQRLSALHEVCHIKLAHWEKQVSREVAAQQERDTDECVKQVLTPWEWRKFNDDQIDAYYLTLKEYITPSDPKFFPHRRTVPKCYVATKAQR